MFLLVSFDRIIGDDCPRVMTLDRTHAYERTQGTRPEGQPVARRYPNVANQANRERAISYKLLSPLTERVATADAWRRQSAPNAGLAPRRDKESAGDQPSDNSHPRQLLRVLYTINPFPDGFQNYALLIVFFLGDVNRA
ncbi:unnamed protein product [Dibothriocephalus latus]|uniref:Uncharacterized protein n=1 Tax=Dibothriocephalus latus TaxID=60516 RepID=A0A3P6QM23_DIBLA|nr:unnamed protein product [Dibothriocephalus latus]